MCNALVKKFKVTLIFICKLLARAVTRDRQTLGLVGEVSISEVGGAVLEVLSCC